MNTADSQPLLQYIRRLASNLPGAPADAELLRRYLVAREDAAFSALVQRHGPMVFSVCQSVLRQGNDAEDAFQATFLILAQKAGSIRRHEGLGGWLQRVAYRVALQARGDKLRRQQRETMTAHTAVVESSSDELAWGELRDILHRELSALPDQFRAPLVLCYLEGLTQEEAAQRLGWSATTVKGRLQRGREKLRQRLERRGVALTAALAAAVTGQALAEPSLQAVQRFTLQTATKAAAALANNYLQPLVSMKLAMLSVVLLSLGVVAGGVVLRSPSEPRPLGSDPSSAKVADKQAQQRTAVDAHGDPLPDGAVVRLGTVRFNHGDGLRTLLFSRDGKTILSRGEHGSCLWDAATGTELVRYNSAQQGWNDSPEVVLRPDGKTMISLHQVDGGDVVRQWDFATQKELQEKKRVLPVQSREIFTGRRNALTPDGRLAALNAPAELRIFDLMTGHELYKVAKGGKDIFDVIFASERLVTVDSKQNIDVWEAKTGKIVRRFAHDAPAGYLAASQDGRWLAVLEHRVGEGISGLPDKDRVHIWDLTTGVKKRVLTAVKHWFYSAYLLGDGKRLLTFGLSPHGWGLMVWDVDSGERLRGIPDVSGSDIVVSPDGRRVAVAVGLNIGKFDLWDLETGNRVSYADGRHAWAAAVSFSPSSSRIHTIGYHSLSTWDAQTGKHLQAVEVPRSKVWNKPARSFSPDGRYAVSFAGDGKDFRAIIWDVAALRQMQTLRLPSKKDHVYLYSHVAFSPDSSWLATWQPIDYDLGQGFKDAETVIHIWDVRTGKEIRSFKEIRCGMSRELSFSADGKTLLAVGTEHTVRLNVADGKTLFSWHVKPLPDPPGAAIGASGKTPDANERCYWSALTVSPDGSRIACILDSGVDGKPLPDRLALYNSRTGKLLRRWSDSGKPTGNGECIAFSADGQLLASCDGFAVHLWETATSKEIRAFRGHRSKIVSLAFSSDGHRLASTSWDSTVLVWDTTGSRGRLTSEAALEESWKALAGEDARRAHEAIGALARTPEKSLPFLKDRVHPVQGVSHAELDRLITDLDSDQFAVREKAAKQLRKLGELAEPALRRTLQGKPSLEQRRRIEPILAEQETNLPSGEALRSLRAVRVLERAGTAEARRLLRELSEGAEGAALTRAAQAARTRLDRRQP